MKNIYEKICREGKLNQNNVEGRVCRGSTCMTQQKFYFVSRGTDIQKMRQVQRDKGSHSKENRIQSTGKERSGDYYNQDCF